MTVRGQSTSTEVIVGPILNVSGSVMVGLDIGNVDIALVKYASVSAARNATTSALSVGPGLYRIVLNSTDTNTLGEMAVWVSGSAALPFVKYVDIQHIPFWNLAYTSTAGEIPSSANVSAIVSGALANREVPSSAAVSAIMNTAMVNRQVPTSAAVSAIMQGALTNYDVASSADVSAIVSVVVSTLLNTYNVASAGEVASAGINSAGVSAIVNAALVNQKLDILVNVSAAAAAPHNNSIIGKIMASASSDAFNRATDSLAAIADGAGAVPLTSAETSAIVAQGLLDRQLHMLVQQSASAAGIHNNSIIGQIFASASSNAYDRTTDSLAAIADGAGAVPLTSAQTSAIVAQGLLDRQLHMLVVQSASVAGIHNNSIIGQIFASASSNAYDRTTDSLAALANGVSLTTDDVSAVVSGVLASYNVASAGEVASAGINSAGISAIIQTALTNYQAATSAAVSAIMQGALTNYDVPTSADVSAIASVVAAQALVDRELHILVNVSAAPTAPHNNSIIGKIMASVSSDAYDRTTDSLAAIADRTEGLSATVAGVSAAVAGVSVAVAGVSAAVAGVSAAVAGVSAAISGRVAQALTDYDVPTSADVSAIGAGVLANYDAPTSADVSAIASVVVAQALADSWAVALNEPISAPQWSSVNRDQGLEWLLFRSHNRHSQTLTEVQVYSSAGTAIASASISNNSVSATRDQFRG